MVSETIRKPLSLRGTFTVDTIRKNKHPDIDKFYEYHKRIMMLKSLLARYPKNKVKYAQEIMECQEEQKKLICKSREKEDIK